MEWLEEKQYYIEHPWFKTWRGVCKRVRFNYFQSFMYFNIRIKNKLTQEKIKFLWFRDKAFLMKKPTIHRKNNKGHYSVRNCKYMEFTEHSRLHYKCHPRFKHTLTRVNKN